jgi:radical SAM protein with 4Fe4S-binding SPASM domain
MSDPQGYVEQRGWSALRLGRGIGTRLYSLDVELTERCQNACIHCYINLPAQDRKVAARELSKTQWLDIFRQAADLGALSLRMTGGEPLLRDDFQELYLGARKLGLKVTVFTNARRITPELADLFMRVPPLEKIEISVYGMRAKSYDAMARAPGAYVEFRRGLDLLLERRIPFLVKWVALPSNQAETEEFDAWARSLPGMDELPATTIRLNLRGRRDSEARNRAIADLRLSPEAELGFHLRGDEGEYKRAQAEFCRDHSTPQGSRIFFCGAGRSISVDAYGRLQPCLLLRDPAVCYDLRGGGSLRDALESFFPHLRQIQSANPDYLERCARCFLRTMCEQCPAQAWMEHGTLDSPVDYLCDITHTQAVHLGLLAPGEKTWQVADGHERVRRLGREVGLDSSPKEGE